MTTIEALSRKEAHVGVVGLGYVGRPLAAALHRHFSVYGFDTEEVVGPIIARESGLEAGSGFHLGYSPERINPGDNAHALERLVKVVASDDRRVLELMSAVYERVTAGGVHRSASIRTAELAKVLENTQRDLNVERAKILVLGLPSRRTWRRCATRGLPTSSMRCSPWRAVFDLRSRS